MIKGILISVQTKYIFFKGLNGQSSFDPELYGKYLTAINSFAHELSQERIKAIVMGNTTLYYHLIDEPSDIILIVIADRYIKKEKVKPFIDDIEDAFLNSYKVEEVVRHASEPKYFDDFEAALNIIAFKNLRQTSF